MNKAELLRQWRRRYFFHMFLCICILAVGYIVGAFLHSQIVWYPEDARKKLEEGHPIICIMGPGDFTTTGHYIVLTAVASDGSIEVHDPNSQKNSDRTWNLEKLMAQTKNLWVYEKK